MSRDQGRRVFVVGIGPGHPEHLTVGAVRALNETDAVFLIDKGPVAAELRDARRRLCEQVIDRAHPHRIVEVSLDAVRDRDDDTSGDAIARWRDNRVDAYER